MRCDVDNNRHTAVVTSHCTLITRDPQRPGPVQFVVAEERGLGMKLAALGSRPS